MRKKLIPVFLVLVTVTTTTAFKKGDLIELQSFLNARSSAAFTKEARNISAVLAKGTKGEILETQKMPSGNFGLKMKVQSGPHAGETYWVYHNVKNPAAKLFNAHKEEITGADLSSVKTAELKVKVRALRAPEEAVVLNAAETARAVLDKNSVKNIVTAPPAPDCMQTSPVVQISEDQYDETQIVEPFRERADSPLQFNTCRTVSGGWDQCKNDKGAVEGFKIINHGPNAIVKSNEYYINREMNFEFEDRARSDMRLIISDSPDDTTSHTTYSILMFFPRSVLPAVRKVGEELEVTLPTKEIVRYNAKTKEVIGGVFKEGPMKQDPKNRNKAVPADIKYTGQGVLIRADKSGDLPYGDTETSSGAKAPSSSIATVSKKGFKDCKIPAKDIWYTDYSKDGNVFMKPELASDAGLDTFLKTKCGFSIF